MRGLVAQHSAARRAWIVLSVVLAIAVSARGQDESSSDGGEVGIACPWFGVGGAVRPGEWAGLRLAISDKSGSPREVLVRIVVPDPDGDRVHYERTLTTNPGVQQRLWMYLRLPNRFDVNSVLEVQAFEAVEGRDDAGQAVFASGRLLWSQRIKPRRVVGRTEGMLGIVGSRPMGLSRYAGPPDQVRNYLPTGHERTEVVGQISAESMPDRWQGLLSYSVVVWNEGLPASLSVDQAEAIREWVRRGGHLVVVLPRVGGAWLDSGNPLSDLVPRVVVSREEGANLTRLGPLITKDSRQELPTSETVQVMTASPGAGPTEAIGILPAYAGSEGREKWLVSRRLVGTGMVTLVGLDAASRWMTERGLPDAELFWHRVLGRRGELEGRATRQGGLPRAAIGRETITLDRDIGDQIAKGEAAGKGVLLGLGVFVLYWLAAGPLGYALLKRKGWQRHAWVGFVAAAGVFTGVAWGGATVLRPSRLSASHLTVLDHVYGQPVQRARSFVSVLIPRYGRATVRVGGGRSDGSEATRNLLSPWEPEGGSGSGFPDARGYRCESTSPDRLTVPTRATVKQFEAEWSGGPRWEMPRPQAIPGREGEPRLRVADVKGERKMEGALVHNMPSALTSVVIIVNVGQKNVARSLNGPGVRTLLSQVGVYSLPADWGPGEALDLGLVLDVTKIGTPRGTTEADRFFQEFLTAGRTGRSDGPGVVDADTTRMAARQVALALFSQLGPPDVSEEQASFNSGERLAQRRSLHGYDVGVWFTQPCVIVIGQIENGPLPFPLESATGAGEWRQIPAEGRTVVRWVYPLEGSPPVIGVVTDEEG
ncbi:MAG: hypothetical protein JNM80_11415 [Phycisphaerae bacterium]|nr:hypothetical protein [Phycisphaerae bacterium]